MTINTELMLKTLAHIEVHPEDWNQELFVTSRGDSLPEGNTCGTAYCFAGHAALLAGWKANSRHSLKGKLDDEQLFIWDAAERALGLTQDEATDLFAMSNTLDDLRRIVSELTGVDLEDRVVSVS